MKLVYRPKSLISGYKLGLSHKDTFVAVPHKMITGDKLNVVYNGVSMVVNNETPVIKSITFDDKFGRGRYTLDYFKWEADNNSFGL